MELALEGAILKNVEKRMVSQEPVVVPSVKTTSKHPVSREQRCRVELTTR